MVRLTLITKKCVHIRLCSAIMRMRKLQTGEIQLAKVCGRSHTLKFQLDEKWKNLTWYTNTSIERITLNFLKSSVPLALPVMKREVSSQQWVDSWILIHVLQTLNSLRFFCVSDDSNQIQFFLFVLRNNSIQTQLISNK